MLPIVTLADYARMRYWNFSASRACLACSAGSGLWSDNAMMSLIPYGNEPEGLGVSQAVGDVGIGLSGRQMLS